MISLQRQMSRVSAPIRSPRMLPLLLPLLFPFLLAACLQRGGVAPGITFNELNAVVALSSNDVWAVGDISTPKPLGSLVLIEHWDGAQWRGAALPAIAGELNAISASSASDIWAVGGGSGQLLTLHWDGVGWHHFSAPLPAHGQDPAEGLFSAVVALSAQNVWAVGQYARQVLVEHWDGTGWNIVPQPFSGGPSTFQAITATAANNVWAVGFANDDPRPHSSLAEHWNGQYWNVVPMPDLFGADLSGLSAAPDGQLWAVGRTNYTPSPLLIEHWDGTAWQAVSRFPPIQPSQDRPATLSAVAAVNAQNVWAVGKLWSGNTSRSEDVLILHWDGHAWQQVDAPSLLHGSQLDALAARSASDIWAVGSSYVHNADTQTLIEHWDGSRWQAVPSPNPGKPGPPIGVD